MKSVLVLYYSRGGHTARISRAVAEQIESSGNRCTVMHISEASKSGLDWSQYDCVALGACVLYGSYDKSVFAFATEHQAALDSIPNSFYSV
ncbi:MAG: protoporphyrinogen oxidase, partial [Shewanella sp.]|nr:protoporphyrinogen oxidase [Shewanella sp.]